MKKIAIALLGIGLLFLLIVYAVIPNPIVVSNMAIVPSPDVAVSRTLQSKAYWKKLWPKSTFGASAFFSAADTLAYKDGIITVPRQYRDGMDCQIITAADTIQSHISIEPTRARDSSLLNWRYSQPASLHPFTRIGQYYEAVAVKKYMTDALTSIKNSLMVETIYGFAIEETSTKDTLLISTSKTGTGKPSTEDMYGLIGVLQKYALQNDARQTDSAIVNVTTIDSQNFKTMVAIPVDKRLPGNENVHFKLMIPGRFLTATVTGGEGTVSNAMNQMQQYFSDYQRTAMAIPYAKLISNRQQERDTSKWVTRLYFPVM